MKDFLLGYLRGAFTVYTASETFSMFALIFAFSEENG